MILKLQPSHAGIQLLIDDGNVFACHGTADETIYHSELGASNAILRAGYNLGSFMVRFPSRAALCAQKSSRLALCADVAFAFAKV